MKGFIIKYSPKDSISRTGLNHALFGRIIYRTYRGKRYSYYSAGILKDVKFARLLASKIFVEAKILEKADEIENLSLYGDIKMSESERDEDNITLLTGNEYWERIANEKGIVLKKLRPKNGNTK